MPLVENIIEDIWFSNVFPFMTVNDYLSLRITSHSGKCITNPEISTLNKFWEKRCRLLYSQIPSNHNCDTTEWIRLYVDIKKYLQIGAINPGYDSNYNYVQFPYLATIVAKDLVELFKLWFIITNRNLLHSHVYLPGRSKYATFEELEGKDVIDAGKANTDHYQSYKETYVNSNIKLLFPLCYGAITGSVRIVEYLLQLVSKEWYSTQISCLNDNETDMDHLETLHRDGMSEIITPLIGAIWYNTNINTTNSTSKPESKFEKRKKIVQLLLSNQYIDPNMGVRNTSQSDYYCQSPLLVCCKQISDMVGERETDNDSYNDLVEIFKMLLNHRDIDVNKEFDGKTPLLTCICDKKLNSVCTHMLIQHPNIDLNCSMRLIGSGANLLMLAIIEDRFDVLKILLDYFDKCITGINNHDHYDCNIDYCCSYSFSYNHSNISKLDGINPLMINKDGRTAFFMACQRDLKYAQLIYQSMKKLKKMKRIRINCDQTRISSIINHQDNHGRTPYIMACKVSQNKQLIEWLFHQCSVDISIKSKANMGGSDYYLKYGKKDNFCPKFHKWLAVCEHRRAKKNYKNKNQQY